MTPTAFDFSNAKPLFQNKVPLKVKLDQILHWIDLPFEKRPQLIMGKESTTMDLYSCSSELIFFLTAYEPSLDQAGHWKGPNSKLVNV